VKLTKELKGYQGLTWDKARRRLGRRRLLLAMEKDDLCVEVAKTYENHGAQAGMAALCALLYYKKYGAPDTARMGVELYADILKRLEKRGKDPSWLRHQVSNMRWGVAWAVHGGIKRWPLEPPKWKKIDAVGGLANIMLWMASLELLSTGTTSECLAGSMVARFLKEGMEKKGERRTKQGEGTK